MVRAICYCAKEFPQYKIEDIGNFTYSRFNTILKMIGYIKDPSKLKKDNPPKFSSPEELKKFLMEKYLG